MKGKEKSTPTKEHTRSHHDDYTKLLREMSSGDIHKAQILRHLMRYGSITQAEAVDNYNCWRLSARIKDLRDADVKITTLRVENIHSTGTHAKYILD